MLALSGQKEENKVRGGGEEEGQEKDRGEGKTERGQDKERRGRRTQAGTGQQEMKEQKDEKVREKRQG